MSSRERPRRSNKLRTREKIAPGKKNEGNISSAPISNGKFWTRNRILAAVGLSAGLALSVAYANKDPQGTASPQPAESKETADLNEISLGNVRFFFQSPESIRPEKKKNIMEKIRHAYVRLAQTFGSDCMMMPGHYDFPIVIGDQIERGMVSWKTEVKIIANGLPEVTNIPEPEALLVNDVTEDVLAHEFVHLYLQAPGNFWTEAFHEGHAYAIQNLLYPAAKDQSSGSINHMVSIPAVREELKMGLDYNLYDQVKLRGGIQDPLLKRLLFEEWAIKWEEFAKANPDFFKSFYAEISRQKKQGKMAFQRNELIEIAQKINPDFIEWYEHEALSMHEIGTTPKTTSSRVIKDTSNGILCVFNFKAVPRVVSGSNMVPPHLQPLYGGQMQAVHDNPATGKKQTDYFPDTYGGFVGILQLPKNILNDPALKVSVGDTVIP